MAIKTNNAAYLRFGASVGNVAPTFTVLFDQSRLTSFADDGTTTVPSTPVISGITLKGSPTTTEAFSIAGLSDDDATQIDAARTLYRSRTKVYVQAFEVIAGAAPATGDVATEFEAYISSVNETITAGSLVEFTLGLEVDESLFNIRSTTIA